MLVAELDYEVSPELLARSPREEAGQRRDESRLLVMNRKDQSVSHTVFRNLAEYLAPGDVVVLNNSKTISGHLTGLLEGQRRIEMLLAGRSPAEGRWNVVFRPDRLVRPGSTVVFGDGIVRATVVDRHPTIGHFWVVHLQWQGDMDEAFARVGKPIMSAYTSRQWSLDRYQTVYAKQSGLVEMPAAGRHFTPELIESLKQRGVRFAFITLHTGLSALDIQVEKLEDHRMYEEYVEVPPETADAVNQARQAGKKILAVGTTVVRSLETAAAADGTVSPIKTWTDLYIYPGYRFKVIDMFITNFHGPRTSRLALAAAFTGVDLLKRGYQAAIAERYRFFEFGDTTLTI